MSKPAKHILTVSGAIYLLFGLSISFFPQETGRIFGTASQYGVDLLLMKVVGALFFGLGVINVMARNAIISGIYGRPITLGNAMMSLIIAGQFLKFNLSQDGVGGHFWIVTVIFSVVTLAFIYLFFTSSRPE
ncbi:MAG: hypothetical protein U5K71_16095 [Gracilimonas sp.]|nr:hypothetical protein [Gracilimonas sp.]